MEILRLSVLGGLLGLDATAVGQFMVSRPLVAGGLTGWMTGNPATGLAIGAMLELYLLVSFPTGGSRFPEGSTATVVAVASAAAFESSAAFPLAVAVGLVWGQVGGATVTAQRHLNSRLVPEPDDPERPGARVSLAHVIAIGLDLARGTVVTMSGIVAGRLVLGAFVERWPLSQPSSTGLLLVGAAVSVGILLHDVGGFRRRPVWFVAGLVLGILGTKVL